MSFFIFRFFFGLYCPSVTADEDYVQTYTIGLKAYTTHTWPYYGPDVQGPETSFKTQMPGALEGLLIALPLTLWPAPESPYLFVNLLSFAALSLLGWYCVKRLPGFPPWFIFTWLYIAPWLTHYSTQVINPSFAFLGAVLFFLGFFETVPALSIGVLNPAPANAFMGFGLFWVMQLHMSWIAMAPLLLVSFYFQARGGKALSSLCFILLGALPLMALLLPTYWRFGFNTGKDVHGFISGLDWDNARDLLGTLARLFSIASFEMARFVGDNARLRMDYFLRFYWLLPPGFFLWGMWYVQALAMLVFLFLRKHPRGDWKGIRLLMAGIFLLLYACFLFTPDMAASFRILLFFPPLMLYSFYVWDWVWQKPWGRLLGLVFILCGCYFQLGYTLENIKAHNSTYAQKRGLMAKAIEAGDYRLFAERRGGSFY
ncbi:MAG TPA: hypothetical protein VK859_14370 [bacterium]|nr:hypothetical protein [bacterium]